MQITATNTSTIPISIIKFSIKGGSVRGCVQTFCSVVTEKNSIY